MVSQVFEQKAEAVKNLSTTPSNDELLQLYGLYKQATIGDNSSARPSALNFKDKYKWDSWESNKGLSQEEAEKKYIALVDEFEAKYN
ncbi:LANO_0D09340g1_1 [Lachancea nothofagi CBS 11611]|uniref:LANO_0D09340g1_1 n=1 Tax=Lachancea nothofagi CBS 11611 TaxID=1266666 RepID=A0A1G4JJV1_9SACH|nr:LANO_0D09340g1_1 [Lachancea nothofagi CBS 11611]